MTTNPTIFASALSRGHAYDDQLRRSAADGHDADRALFDLTTSDVRDACDELRSVYDRTNGVDGRVSIEVDPRLARDTARTTDMARALFVAVDRPNVMIKIPATPEGLPAITQIIGEGISVNVTLIFALSRYEEVFQAYLNGLGQARAAGRDLGSIHSVASFFVSRVDTEIDARLDALGTASAAALRGRAAVANARLAFEVFEQSLGTARWQELSAAGANPQRPLWASTGVKNHEYRDTMYVTDLVASGTVNTMPASTLEAVADHALIAGDTVRSHYVDAHRFMRELKDEGIDLDEVTALLERQGLEKFETSWAELTEVVQREHRAVQTSEAESVQRRVL
ncbi:transaldolase [Kineosporia sp. NBRC 101731]|nr:transaldolase [Kineosporia sp. NBRC 101731]